MINIKRILLPTDFSRQATVAMTYACAFVDLFDAELHLLHVLEIHPVAVPNFTGGLALNNYIKESREAADKALANVLESQWDKGHQIVRSTADGMPGPEIVDYAKEHEIDLIVMGTHGRTGLSHLMMGSVAEKVLRGAPCPVLTVRPSEH